MNDSVGQPGMKKLTCARWGEKGASLYQKIYRTLNSAGEVSTDHQNEKMIFNAKLALPAFWMAWMQNKFFCTLNVIDESSCYLEKL